MKSRRKFSTRSREEGSPPSNWQLKYNQIQSRKDSNNSDEEDIGTWIEMVKEKSRSDAVAMETPLVSTDDEVAEVMMLMDKVLSEVAHNEDFGIDLNIEDNEVDQFGFEFLSLSTDVRSSHDKSLETHPSLKEDDKHSFSSEQMIKLFRRARDEKVLRKCIGSLGQNSNREKKRLDRIEQIVFKKKQGKVLGGSFLLWKHHARMVKVKETVLICKFGRVTSKRFRGAFLEWKRKAIFQNSVLRDVVDKHKLKTLRAVFSGWTSAIRKARNYDEALQVRFRTKSKSKAFSSWRRTIQIIKARKERHERAKQADIVRILRFHFTLWLSNFKYSKEQEMDRSHWNQQLPQANSYCPNAKPENGISECYTATEATTDDVSKEINRTRAFFRDGTDKENHRPNIFVSPLKTSKKVPQLKSPTPKLVLDMQKRQKDREMRREILRSKYEQSAVERKQRDEEERRRKEQEELRLHDAFIQKKAEEEERKLQIALRRKQAFRLAFLHRNAYLSWCDVTHEKYFRQWRKVKDEEKKRKNQRALKRRQLADDFNERRLLAKSLAAWQEMCDYMKLTVHQVRLKVSGRYRGLLLARWRDLTIKVRADRSSKENCAMTFGKRLRLRMVIHQWRSGIILFKKEREMEKLVEAKRMQIYSWLGGL
ncbi:hypothetical protein ACHAWX_007048 [Stephanocyclus meneghinianus]